MEYNRYVPSQFSEVSDTSQAYYSSHKSDVFYENQIKQSLTDTREKINSINHTRRLIMDEYNPDIEEKNKIKIDRTLNRMVNSLLNHNIELTTDIGEAQKETKVTLWDAQQHYQDNAAEYHDLGRFMMEGEGSEYKYIGVDYGKLGQSEGGEI